MAHTRNLLLAATATCVASFIALPLEALAQPRTVASVRIVAKPRAYVGHCPATLEFIATIRVSRHPVRVEYQWERSDGGRGPREVIEIRSAGQGVTDTWTLGGPGQRRVVWERLHVLAPTGISSPQARVRIDCRR